MNAPALGAAARRDEDLYPQVCPQHPPGGDFDEIWLAPICRDPRSCLYPDAIEGNGGDRLWCKDNVWSPCSRCGARATRYVRDRRTGRGR